MKQIEVQILQQSYLLSCHEGQEARLLDAVERVDTAMTRIRDAGKVRVRERIAVLAALNLAFELAERENAAITAAAQAEAGATPLPPGASQRLQTLVQRLDDALGTNGMLFE
ncbi:cell division protein ZapA [Extensimonas sp. H3M7-6]|uniref:cell division protein ZapA n=1 Tax=Extensimonas soli TaxID=3031322 RepID=UPI0023DA45AB|nr:cell division protein ZapA [Extensimonas sp. H3M7-6]MDF1483450.1 cell division protein ZapA [Extensimonas sp. H3M7-6]